MPLGPSGHMKTFGALIIWISQQKKVEIITTTDPIINIIQKICGGAKCWGRGHKFEASFYKLRHYGTYLLFQSYNLHFQIKDKIGNPSYNERSTIYTLHPPPTPSFRKTKVVSFIAKNQPVTWKTYLYLQTTSYPPHFLTPQPAGLATPSKL